MLFPTVQLFLDINILALLCNTKLMFFLKKKKNQAVVKAVKTFQLEHCKRRKEISG